MPVDRADVIGAGARSLAAWCGRFLLFAAAIVVVGWVTGKLWGAILPIVLALLITQLFPRQIIGLFGSAIAMRRYLKV